MSGLQFREHPELTGHLNNIRSTVASAWVCVVPLRICSGTRLKILEAIALGTPVFATPKGIEGLGLKPEREILIADSPESFANQVLRLHNDSDLRTRLAENGRRLVIEKYNWARMGDQFNSLVQSISCSDGQIQ